jgi:hypothetical protein
MIQDSILVCSPDLRIPHTAEVVEEAFAEFGFENKEAAES